MITIRWTRLANRVIELTQNGNILIEILIFYDDYIVNEGTSKEQQETRCTRVPV